MLGKKKEKKKTKMSQNSKMTQQQRILDYLDEFGGITRLDGLRDLGIMNLPTRIF